MVNIMVNEENPGDKRMKDAYAVSKKLVYSRLKNEEKENIRILEDLNDTDIIVVKGSFDHIHQVLDLLDMPYKMITDMQLPKLNLRADQTIFVNCPSSFSPVAARKIRTFVEQGGQLITTDWGIKHVLEQAFPGTVRYNGNSTADEVIRIELVDKEDELVRGFLDEKSDPVWWLEGSSYPIEILDKKRVKVLIKSKELGKRYGENPVMIRFEWGKGVVYHMISHLYLQRTETRDQRQASAKEKYFKDKIADPTTYETMKSEFAEVDLNYGEVQSANTTSEFMSRAVLGQKKRFMKKKADEK